MRKLSSFIPVLALFLLLSACATVTPLGKAAKDGNIKEVEALIRNGADVNEVRTPGLSPLHEAVFNDASPEIIRLLLDKGADVNKKSCGDGWATDCNCATPLYIAACKGNIRVVRLLLERGADPFLVHYDKKTPLQVARENGFMPIVQLLQDAQEKQQKDIVASKDEKVTPSDKRPVNAPLKSDVDELPAFKVKPNKSAYAIVIGIENYRLKLPRADFAAGDAKLVSEYLIKTMGYPEENVILLTNENALQSDLAKYFEQWLTNHVEQDSTLFVYYSGHGAPNPKTGDAYLVPYDGDPSFIAQTGYSLKKLYTVLGNLPSKRIIVALDSCFSGGGARSVIAKGMRPLVIDLQSSAVLPKNMAVLSASSGEQTGSTYDEKGHGLFTYFLLKGIRNEDVLSPDGSIKVKNLFEYLKPEVERIARRQYNNEQTPQFIGH